MLTLLIMTACGGSDDTNEELPPSTPPTEATVTTTLPAPVDAADGTLPLAEEALDDPEVTTVATDLAPSQIAGSTVAEPATPPPCTGADVDVFTARVERSGDSVDAILRVRNTSDEWCEPDIGRSPLFDPRVEPDVWLFPGDSADLRVGQSTEGCKAPSWVRLVQIGIGEDSVVVPSAVYTCGWWLNAFLPLTPPVERCAADDLQVLATDRAVVIRTAGDACRFDGVVEALDVDGGDRTGVRDAAAPQFVDLYPGDIAAIGLSSSIACDDPPATVDIRLTGGGTATINSVPCDVEFWPGFAAPWIGSGAGPLASDDDSEGVLEALAPFDR